MLKKIIKGFMVTSLLIVGLLVIIYFIFTKFYPSFGGAISEEQQLVYQSSNQFHGGKFNNTNPVPKELNFSETMKLAYAYFTTKAPNSRPKTDLKVTKIDSVNVADYRGKARMVWFGHSTFLLQIDGKNILIDPMFGKVAAPHPLLGGHRFSKELPIEIEELPHIDGVIYSHDHYDHLDYQSVLRIKDKTNHFYVPLGVGSHLLAWNVPSNKITELDWWQKTQLESLTFICTPAQHFSGRKFNTSQSTLWSSWVIQSKTESIFFSGDSGYASHFMEIGNKYGPFDLALLECGQYSELWPDVHMMPEQTARAGLDVKAKKIMAIHWAGFKMAMHAWKDPIERVRAKAAELNIEIITPKIGEEIIVKDTLNHYTNWWKNL